MEQPKAGPLGLQEWQRAEGRGGCPATCVCSDSGSPTAGDMTLHCVTAEDVPSVYMVCTGNKREKIQVLSKLKTYVQRTLSRVRKTIGWGKVFANHVSGKGVTARMYKELKVNKRKT